MNFVFSLLIGILILNYSWASGHDHHLPDGGRKGLHGMVIYGSGGKYILDHIPMEHEPHDLQVLATVKLVDKWGQPLLADFSNATWTIKPDTKFSLNDYVNGKLKLFSAQIYSGGFEQNGKLFLESIKVEVQNIKLVRKIPGDHTRNLIQVKLGSEIFDVNVITPGQNFQKITNRKTGAILWCAKGPDFFEFCD